MELDSPRKTAKGFAAAAMVVVIWSGFNIVSRFGSKNALTPFDIAAIRFTVSGILFLPLFIFRQRSMTGLQLLILTAIGGISYSLFVYSGFARAPAAHAGILVNGGIPFATALVSWAAMGYKPGRQAMFALLIAGLGIAIIGVQSFSHDDSPSGGQWLGDIFFLCAATSFAIFGLLLKKWRIPPIDITVGIAVASSLFYLPVYILFLPKALSSVPTSLLLIQCLYQGVLAASVAQLLYTYANQTIGPIKASLMLALVPGVSALAAVPLLGEELGLMTVAGVVLVTCGAFLGTTNQKS